MSHFEALALERLSAVGTRQKFSLLQQLSLLLKVDLPWLRPALDGER